MADYALHLAYLIYIPVDPIQMSTFLYQNRDELEGVCQSEVWHQTALKHEYKKMA